MAPIWSEEAGPPGSPLIVLVHGSMDRSTGMLRLSRRLDDRFRVLRYDRRGYGRSASPRLGDDASAPTDSVTPMSGEDVASPERYDMDAQVDDLVTVLAGRRALVIGHSYGGNVAMTTAARHPELVAGVALYETPLSWEPWWPGTTGEGGAWMTKGHPTDAAERFMRGLIGDELWESLPPRTRATRRAEGVAMVGELSDLRAHRPWVPDDISCPVVVGYGSDGRGHHRRAMEMVHDMLPGSTCVQLTGCRHDAPLSDSQQFADVIVAALAHAAGEPWASAFGKPATAPPAGSAPGGGLE